ncbi:MULTISPECIES: ketopantoate reductase family protein [Pseudonocardia]|uniref:2-dehydropantoate 2-reductase n=2 Tax=Pseudonocardia TaxID=1847 RepID=A0A1Y2MHP2_PSEAH|nr:MULTISPECIES: 2-dehydropantoate 2-reductase N-terminal domain-containing protein [Pseudonocardia]OSY34805.1 2-dehydropantoate 2-reductase [Pseudonocardia autotrophica]TDN76942.1 ketopantoate reductase [Pseudonocardia autotrophica]BBG00946.1 2-dehydropantoate 2-reductase [Pseudonocardia autotrophica]GEC29052.1 2-dehydropantoate 2-reductase [Pseudonocardia saturnea]
MSRYVVIGAGAVGATLAAELHLAGRPVVLVARGEHGAILRRDGLRYVRPDGERQVPVPTIGGPGEIELGPGDVLVLATKTQDAESALAGWAWQPVGDRAAAEVLPVITLQNGLDTERVALRRFATVWAAVSWSPSEFVTPGEIAVPAAPAVGVLWIGRFPAGRDPRLAAVAEELRSARHLVEPVDDIGRWKAGKLLPILGNALDALYEAGPLRDAAAAALQAEAREVYRAAGIDPADLRAETTLDLKAFAPAPIPDRPAGGRSTWQSLARGVSPETDFLNGEIILLARLHGVPAPRNTAVAARLQRAVRERTPAGSLPTADLLELLPGLDAPAAV